MVEVKEEKDLDSLFTGGKTTALTNTISGLDDFELITFVVIRKLDEPTQPCKTCAAVSYPKQAEFGRTLPQEQDLRTQWCQHPAERHVRGAGRTDRLAL